MNHAHDMMLLNIGFCVGVVVGWVSAIVGCFIAFRQLMRKYLTK